jgi:hypothetical protein
MWTVITYLSMQQSWVGSCTQLRVDGLGDNIKRDMGGVAC